MAEISRALCGAGCMILGGGFDIVLHGGTHGNRTCSLILSHGS